jgi:hypothetical protein
MPGRSVKPLDPAGMFVVERDSQPMRTKQLTSRNYTVAGERSVYVRGMKSVIDVHDGSQASGPGSRKW